MAIVTIAMSLFSRACICSSHQGSKQAVDEAALKLASSFVLDKDKAEADLTELTKAPHPLGSARQHEIAAYIQNRLSGSLQVIQEAFSVAVPNRAATNAAMSELTLTKSGTNVYGLPRDLPQAPCIVLLASHFDTKDIPGLQYVGANDSGSSSIALLQQLAYLAAQRPTQGESCAIGGVFFDGEEPVLSNWEDGLSRHPAKIQDNTYGSRHAASQLTACDFKDQKAQCMPAHLGGKPLIALVLMDMIGSPEVVLSPDYNSSIKLTQLAKEGAVALGYPNVFSAFYQNIEDDHIPYVKKAIPAIDLIDFQNLQFWHRSGDEKSNISFESIELSAKIALYTAIAAANSPKVFP